MNLTSLPKINFYKNTSLPSPKVSSKKKTGGIGGNFYSIDPDLVNQQRNSIKGGIKSGAKGAAYGAGLTVGAMENAVKGMVASIFKKQNQRNRQKFNSARSAAASKSDTVASLVPAINANTVAVNRLGATSNSIISSLGQSLKIEQARYKQEKALRAKSFKPTFQKREKVKFGLGGLTSSLFQKMGSFWDAISGLIGGLLKFLFIKGILEYIANPKNRQKIITILEVGKKIVTFLYNFTTGRIAGIIDGLSNAFNKDKNLKERLGGAFGALTNLGLLLLGIRWLSNPMNIIRDVGFVLGKFKSALTLFLKFVSVPFKLASWAIAAPIRLAARNPKAALAIAAAGLIGGVAAKNKYDTDEEFKAEVDKRYAGAKDFTTEQWNKALAELGTVRNALRGDQATIADNIRDQASGVTDAITGQFSELVGEQQPSTSIPFIGQDGQTGESFIEQYLEKNTEFQGETVDAITELGANLNESLKLNKSIVDALNTVGLTTDSPVLPERSLGGIVNSFSKGGGYIKGPKSGYPVSLDGGKSASFIGHGTEYVSKKDDGSAFVVPIDTPHTDRNPNLQIKRTQEAMSQGYGLKGMSIGGSFSSGLGGSDGMFGLGSISSNSTFTPSPRASWRTPASELEKLRGNAALNSISQSTNASRILSGSSRSPIVNQIANDSLNRSAFGSIFGGTASSPPISPIVGGLSKQLLVSPQPSSPPLGGPTPPSSPPLGGPTPPSSPPLGGPTPPPTKPLGGPTPPLYYPFTKAPESKPKPKQGGGFFNDIWNRITGTSGGNQSTPSSSSSQQISPRQRMLQQRYQRILKSGNKGAIYNFRRRYGGRTPGIPRPDDGKGYNWGWNLRRTLEKEYYDDRWYEGGDGGTNLPDIPKMLGLSKGGKGYQPKMSGPQIRMRPGPHQLQHAPSGGWITGPLSGYPVSVKGKNRPDFIAHGTEYISKKPTGEYSVLPYHGMGGKTEDLSRRLAASQGFGLPTKAPSPSDLDHPSSQVSSITPGKQGSFLGGLFDGVKNAIGGLFGGGGGGDNSGGGNDDGGGGFFSGIGNAISGLFGGGNKTPIANETPGLNLNPFTQAAMSQGQKWGFQYGDNGMIKGGSILPGLMRQAGGLGKEIGAMFGNEGLGSSVGDSLFTIFGGGGSNEDGSATFGDITGKLAGLAGQLFKDKDGLLGDIGNYANIFFGPGADRFTFGEKLALALQQGLNGSKYSKYVRPFASALGVDIDNSVSWAQELNGEGLAGEGSNEAQAASDVGSAGPAGSGTSGGGFSEDLGMPGGGLRASIASGRNILAKGFSVFNHPNFRNNKWAEFGANQGIGFAQGGGEKTVGDRHAMGLALNVGDFREQGRLSRLTSLANNLYSNKLGEKLINVTYDNWGTWQLGGDREGPGKYGFPDTLHLGYAKEERGGSGSSLGPVQGGLTETQAQATASAVGQNLPSQSTVGDAAAAVNAITNEATQSGADLGSILGSDYGFGTDTFLKGFDEKKLTDMYDMSQNVDPTKDLFGTGIDFGSVMNTASDPNSLYTTLLSEGKPAGEAENMVNANEFYPIGGGLSFSSKDTANYDPGMLTGVGDTPVNHFLTNTDNLYQRDTMNRFLGSSESSSPSDHDDVLQFPFYAPSDPNGTTPQSKNGGAGADYLSAINKGNFGLGGNPPGGSDEQELGGDMGGGDMGGGQSTVSKSQTETADEQNKTGAFKYATRERSYAQSRIGEQAGQMVQGAIARVEAINADVKAAVADAQARVSTMQQSSGSSNGVGSSQQAGNIGLLAQMGRNFA